MIEGKQEMTLREWTERLTPSHRARKELDELVKALEVAKELLEMDGECWNPGTAAYLWRHGAEDLIAQHKETTG